MEALSWLNAVLTDSRHVTALAMPDKPPSRPEVTREMVDELWALAVDPHSDRFAVNHRAEDLLAQVNSESPLVNWGLTDLYHLTGSAATTRDELARSRAHWLAEVERYEAGPVLWMRDYFRDMVRDFAERHGAERGRAFAAKLVRDGQLGWPDLPTELRE